VLCYVRGRVGGLVHWAEAGWTTCLDDGGFDFDTVWIALVFYQPFVACRRI
jgi:hypothetical protein